MVNVKILLLNSNIYSVIKQKNKNKKANLKGKGKTMKKSRFLTAIILAVLFVFTASALELDTAETERRLISSSNFLCATSRAFSATMI